jgi:hypothetical protein
MMCFNHFPIFGSWRENCYFMCNDEPTFGGGFVHGTQTMSVNQ